MGAGSPPPPTPSANPKNPNSLGAGGGRGIMNGETPPLCYRGPKGSSGQPGAEVDAHGAAASEEKMEEVVVEAEAS